MRLRPLLTAVWPATRDVAEPRSGKHTATRPAASTRATCARTPGCLFAPEHDGTCLPRPHRGQVTR